MQILQAGTTYHYCFEVDGALRYDYAAEYEKTAFGKFYAAKHEVRENDGRRARVTANVLQVPHQMPMHQQQDLNTTASSFDSYSSSNSDGDISGTPIIYWIKPTKCWIAPKQVTINNNPRLNAGCCSIE
jgi:hypothetical protein